MGGAIDEVVDVRPADEDVEGARDVGLELDRQPENVDGLALGAEAGDRESGGGILRRAVWRGALALPQIRDSMA